MIKKNKTLTIRIEAKELEIIKHFAKLSNLSVSDYVRSRALGYKIKKGG